MNDDKRIPHWVETPLGPFVILEFIAVLIGLAMPITPSKTGSKRDIAEYFITDPSYLEKAFVAFVITNILFVILGVIVYVYWRLSRTRKESDS